MNTIQLPEQHHQYYFQDELLQHQCKKSKKAQSSHYSIFQSVLINEKVVKPIELYLNSSLDKEMKSQKKNPLEVLENYSKEGDVYTTRNIQPDDGLLYYLTQKPGKLEMGGVGQSKLRKIRYLICITMYNESRDELLNTLQGVYDNLPSFIDAGICTEDIAVCVVCDGILSLSKTCVEYFKFLDKQIFDLKNNNTSEQKNQQSESKENSYKKKEISISQRLADIQAAHKAYIEKVKDKKEQEKRKNDISKVMPPTIPRKTAIVYQTRISGKDLPSGNSKSYMKKKYTKENLNVFFVVKILKKGKLSSHLWFFSGFCKTLNPEFTCLIDCGTVPDCKGLYNYYRVLETNPKIGGVCGYLGCRSVSEFKLCCEETTRLCIPFQSLMEFFHCKKRKENVNTPNNNNKEMSTKKKLEEKKKIMIVKRQQLISKKYLYRFIRCIVLMIFRIFDFLWSLLIWLIDCYMTVMERIFSIQDAQLFEYTFFHIYDKSFESMFGFSAVLPGTWSAYRWDALFENDLLQKEYLKTVLDPNFTFKTINEANQILVEDRLFSLAIFTNKNMDFTIKYVPDAVAHTDIMDSLIGLMMERKRWINGSWYAMEHVLNYLANIPFSRHSQFQKVLFCISQSMAKLNIFLTYCSLGIYFATMYITIFTLFGNWSLWQNEVEPRYNGERFQFQSLAGLMCFVYILLVTSLIYYSLSMTARQTSFEFRVISHFLCLYVWIVLATMSYMIAQTIYFKREDYFAGGDQMTYLLVIDFGCYILLVLFNPKSITKIIRSFLAYLYFLPCYMHTFLIYAFCRIDDLSCGKKGTHSTDENKKSLEFKADKVKFVSTWVLLNAILAIVCIYLNAIKPDENYFFLVLAYLCTAHAFFKSTVAIIHQVKFNLIERPLMWCKMRCRRKNFKKESDDIKDFYEKKVAIKDVVKDEKSLTEEKKKKIWCRKIIRRKIMKVKTLKKVKKMKMNMKMNMKKEMMMKINQIR